MQKILRNKTRSEVTLLNWRQFNKVSSERVLKNCTIESTK